MAGNIPRSLRSGTAIKFTLPPPGLEIAAALIPAHEQLSEQGFTSRFTLPFARTISGARFAMGLDEDNQPRFADRMNITDPLMFQLRELVMPAELDDALAQVSGPRTSTVEVGLFTDSNHSSPFLTLGGLANKLLISPDIPMLDSPELISDAETRTRVLNAGKEMAEVVTTVLIAHLAPHQPERFER